MDQHLSFKFDGVAGMWDVHAFTREARAFLKRWQAAEGTKPWLVHKAFISLSEADCERFHARAQAKFGVAA